VVCILFKWGLITFSILPNDSWQKSYDLRVQNDVNIATRILWISVYLSPVRELYRAFHNVLRDYKRL
jgi:hypothetical protein